jgi:transcriptional regulator with XRE-family HTH domain
MTPRQIGTRIKKLRTAQGLSQEALAKRAKISREYVNRLEADSTTLPSAWRGGSRKPSACR